VLKGGDDPETLESLSEKGKRYFKFLQEISTTDVRFYLHIILDDRSKEGHHVNELLAAASKTDDWD
jgi:hypothetical protein